MVEEFQAETNMEAEGQDTLRWTDKGEQKRSRQHGILDDTCRQISARETAANTCTQGSSGREQSDTAAARLPRSEQTLLPHQPTKLGRNAKSKKGKRQHKQWKGKQNGITTLVSHNPNNHVKGIKTQRHHIMIKADFQPEEMMSRKVHT